MSSKLLQVCLPFLCANPGSCLCAFLFLFNEFLVEKKIYRGLEECSNPTVSEKKCIAMTMTYDKIYSICRT